jgi:hypothetical protein
VDRGGTFTDIVCKKPDGTVGVLKLLSVDPRNYSDAPREGIRRLLELYTGLPHPRGAPVPTSRIKSSRMGTTVATKALLERKGDRTWGVTLSDGISNSDSNGAGPLRRVGPNGELLRAEDYYNDGYGDGSGEQSYINIQPVIPFSISPDWNVISRTIIPLVDQDDIAPGSGSQSVSA